MAEPPVRPVSLKNRAAFALLAALAFVVYANTLGSTFHFDDMAGIVKNVEIRRLDFARIWDAFNTRFLLGVTFALNYALGGLRPAGYHAVNVALHALAASGVFLLGAELLPADGKRRLQSRWVALGAAVLFLVHPVQTQAVNYVWQRAAVLSTALYVLSLYAYARARRGGSARAYAASLVLGIAAMFSKETAVTLPVAVALYEWALGGKAGRRRWDLVVPFAVLLAVIPVTLTRAPKVTLDLMRPNVPVHDVSPGFLDFTKKFRGTRWVEETSMRAADYHRTQLPVFATYLRLLVLPVRQNVDYDYPLARSGADPRFLAAAALLALYAAAAALALKRAPLAGLLMAWFFVALLPEALVVQSDVIFEHRLYLPMAAASIGASLLLARAFADPRRFAIALTVATALFGALTVRRNAVWADEKTLWSDAMAKSPAKPRPIRNLAVHYDANGRFLQALEMNRRALAMDPGSPKAHYNIGVELYLLGRREEAFASWKKAIELEPRFEKAYHSLCNGFSEAGRSAEAESWCLKAIELNPRFDEAYVTLGIVYRELGRSGEALGALERAVGINPDFPEAHNALGAVLLESGRAEEAAAHFRQALRLLPDFPEARANLAEAVGSIDKK